MLGVAADVEKTLGDGMKEERIKHAGILEHERTEFLRQGGNHMDIRCGQDFSLSIGEPGGLGCTMTFGAVPVAVRVIRRLLVLAVITLSQVSAKGRRAAQLDSAQGAMLCAAQPVSIALQESPAMLAHHVSDFKLRATHNS